MSVKTLIATQDVREHFERLLRAVTLPRKLVLRVPPRTTNFGLVGTAFDYALRFELQRRNPHAIVKEWAAEAAIDRVPKAAERLGLSTRGSRKVQKLAQDVVTNARAFVAAHLVNTTPAASDLATLATHSLRLAKLDNVYRAYRLDPAIDEVDHEDVPDVVDLLAIVPYELLSHPTIMLLNPTFGTYSDVTGGADADLITGDLLLDFKSTMTVVKREALLQLLAYLMLSRRAQAEDQAFPKIHRFGLYLSRQAHLWTMDAESITSQPGYSEVEDWFIQYAADTQMDPDLRELRELEREDAPRAGNKLIGSQRQPGRGRTNPARGGSKRRQRKV